jgi:hypothetical protein
MTLPIEHASPTSKILMALIPMNGKHAIETPAMMTHRVPIKPRETRLENPSKDSLCESYAKPGASTICMADGSAMTQAARAGVIPSALIR